MGRNLTKQEVIDVVNLALKNFNNAYRCGSISVKNTDGGIGTAIEPFICDALCKVTNVTWRKGDNNKDCDFICGDSKYNPFELKTALSGQFTGGCEGGREQALLKGKESTKYSIEHDKNKICIYDDVQYVLVKIDRPWNGWNNYYVNKIYHGNLKEIDWNPSKHVEAEKLNKLLILDNSNTYERNMRYPFHQETSTSKNVNFTLIDSGKNVILNTYDIESLIYFENLIKQQKKYSKEIAINNIINDVKKYRLDELGGLDVLINRLKEMKNN